MQKAELFIEQIVTADNEDKAVKVLINIANELGIDRRYSSLVTVGNRLKDYQKAFKTTRARLNVPVPDLELLLDIRREVSFAYNEFVDELSSSINGSKVEFGEDARKVAKAQSYIEVKEDEALIEKVGKTATVLKEMVGNAESYVSWLNCHKLSYANWVTYRGMLDSWKLFSDYIASAVRQEQTIKIQDTK